MSFCGTGDTFGEGGILTIVAQPGKLRTRLIVAGRIPTWRKQKSQNSRKKEFSLSMLALRFAFRLWRYLQERVSAPFSLDELSSTGHGRGRL
jgi:hypothetical protein